MSVVLEQRKVNVLEVQFQEAILDSYLNYNQENALFLAERFNSICESEKSKCILAECYLNSQKFWCAYELLKNLKNNRAKFLFAQSCFRINKLEEAEKALFPEGVKINNKQSFDQILCGAHGLFLLGQIKEKARKMDEASECYLRAFEKNPLIFNALEKYLSLTEKVEEKEVENLVEIFKIKNTSEIGQIEITHSLLNQFEELIKIQKENAIFTDLSQKKNIPDKKKQITAQPIKLEEIKKVSISMKKSPSKKKSKELSKSSSFTKQIFTQNPPRQKSIFDLLSLIAKPMAFFQIENHKKSLEYFQNLPSCFQNDPWVLIHIGKCFTEFSNHKEAEHYFNLAYQSNSSRIEGFEYYSSCLWHLKKLKELSSLANSCLQKYFFASETWITLANCYSLNQDHDTALTLLQRAIQINPQNAYAYCLSGHEYSSKEQYEKAKELYKKAINLDKRNVRAYWGLGNLNLKTEKYRKAIDYFSHAIKINNETSTVYTQRAIAHMNLEEYQEALINIKQAEKLAPNDAFNRYHKAQILMKLQKFDESEEVCQGLLKDFQKEPQIFILMGNILQQKGMKKEAHKAYIQAQNLDQKNGQKIKHLIENLHPSIQQFNFDGNRFFQVCSKMAQCCFQRFFC